MRKEYFMSKSDITKKLERLSAFEERLGVTLTGLSVFFESQDPEYYDDDEITILGELKVQTGTEIPENIELVAAVYDNEERVIGTSSSTFYPEYYDDDEITILGELKVQTGTEIPENIELVAAVYDNEERVIGTSSSTFYADDFFTLETFEMDVSIPKHLNILKVRIYPKKS